MVAIWNQQSLEPVVSMEPADQGLDRVEFSCGLRKATQFGPRVRLGPRKSNNQTSSLAHPARPSAEVGDANATAVSQETVGGETPSLGST